MKSELDPKTGLPSQIQIESCPDNLNLDKIVFESIDFKKAQIEPQGKCLINAFNVSKLNPAVEIIEGAVVYINTSNEGSVFFHAWNRIGEKYFDLTSERTWSILEDFKNTKEIRYAPIRSYYAKEFSGVNEISFSDETKEMILEMKQALKKD